MGKEPAVSGRRAKKDRVGKPGSGKRRRGGRSRRGEAVRRSRRRRWTFFSIAVAALSLAAYLLKPAIFGRAGPPADAAIIDISADMGGFDRRVIRVKAGEPVTVRLTSLDNRFHTDGGGRHQFAVDELDVNIIAPSLGSASETFTPTKPGTYTFYCDICCGGKANPTMSGTLVVGA